MDKQPASLYYYGGPELLKSLKKGVISLSQDWSMLQPFVNFSQYQQSAMRSISESEILSGLKAEYDKLPANIRLLLSYTDFLKQREKLEPSIRQQILATRSTEKAQTAYLQRHIQQACHLRLFSSATLAFAWHQLAADYAGLCIQLSSRATCFSSDKGKPQLLQAVRYGANHELKPSGNNPIPGVFEDTQEHEGMAEWRLVRPAKQSRELKLQQGDVQRIFISIHTPKSLIEQVRELIRLDLRYRHSPLFEVYPDASCWRLTARPI